MFKSMSFDLKEVAKLFKQKRVLELRGMSNRLIREAAIEENYAKAELGVITYALHKLCTKQHISESEKWQKVKQIISSDLDGAEYAASQNNSKMLIKKLKSIVNHIQITDSELGNYAQNIYEKSKVKQASLAYSYGLSIAQSAELTGADKKELQSYVGFTKMSDEGTEQKKIIQRVNDLVEWLNA
jgi:hypothetical protein